MSIDPILPGTAYRQDAAPGLYELRDAAPRNIDVRMDVAGFVGLCARGPVGRAVAVESFDQFRREFGDAGGGRQLPQAVHDFFINGGRRCVVVRAADVDNITAAVWALPGLEHDNKNAVTLEARNPGLWGNSLFGQVGFTVRALRVGQLVTGNQARVREESAEPTAAIGALLRFVPRDRGDPTLRFVRQIDLDDLGPVYRVGWLPPVYRDALVEEVQVAVQIGTGDLVETYVGGLHPDHPRFLLGLLGDEPRPLGRPISPYPRFGSDEAPPPDPQLFATEPSRILRAMPGSARPIVPTVRVDTREVHVLTTRVSAGTDAELTTERRHFFAATEPFAALTAYDRENRGQPVSLLNFPDLAHMPRQDSVEGFNDVPAREPSSRFELCAQAPTRIYAGRSDAYPRLRTTTDDLDALLLDHVRIVRAVEADGGRIAVLDLPPDLYPEEIRRWRLRVASPRSALYAPFLRVPPAHEPTAPLISVPPGGAVCGIVARAEGSGGVHAAPANLDLAGVTQLDDRPLPDASFLHQVRVNLIRPSPTGFTLLGSRTTSLDADWTHINVRRVVDYLERQLPVDAEWAVFEPNNRHLWRRLEGLANRRLRALFDAGALAGSRPEAAWFVRSDGTVNDLRERDAGRATVLVGVAPSVPAEFVVFRLTLFEEGTIRAQEQPRAR